MNTVSIPGSLNLLYPKSLYGYDAVLSKITFHAVPVHTIRILPSSPDRSPAAGWYKVSGCAGNPVPIS